MKFALCFFLLQDCIGCIDDTHINACIPEEDQLCYRGRNPTFNEATCDFDMCFTFLSVGEEGSAHETRIFVHTINTPALNFPKPPQGIVIYIFFVTKKFYIK